MNIKKILVLLLFLVAIIGILAPVNAKINVEAYSPKKPTDGKSSINLYVISKVGKNNFDESHKAQVARKKELSKVNKMSIKVKGYKKVVFKKPSKGWKLEYKNFYIFKSFSVKGKASGKNYLMKFYNKKGKLFRSVKGKVMAHEYDTN